jgi:hypothetical protein
VPRRCGRLLGAATLVAAADRDGNGIISPYDIVQLNGLLPKGMTCP